MLGPIFFSWDVQGQTYQGFLSALQNKLQGAPQSSIILVLTKKLGECYTSMLSPLTFKY